MISLTYEIIKKPNKLIYREQIGGRLRHGVGGGVGKTSEGGQKVQTFNYKINPGAIKVHHDAYS